MGRSSSLQHNILRSFYLVLVSGTLQTLQSFLFVTSSLLFKKFYWRKTTHILWVGLISLIAHSFIDLRSVILSFLSFSFSAGVAWRGTILRGVNSQFLPRNLVFPDLKSKHC